MIAHGFGVKKQLVINGSEEQHRNLNILFKGNEYKKKSRVKVSDSTNFRTKSSLIATPRQRGTLKRRRRKEKNAYRRLDSPYQRNRCVCVCVFCVTRNNGFVDSRTKNHFIAAF